MGGASTDGTILARVARNYTEVGGHTLGRGPGPSNAQFAYYGIKENGAQEARKGYPLTGLGAGPVRVIKGRALLKFVVLKKPIFHSSF